MTKNQKRQREDYVLYHKTKQEWEREQRFKWDDEENIFGGIHEKFLFELQGYNYIEFFTGQFGRGEEFYNNFIEDEEYMFCYNEWLNGEGLDDEGKDDYVVEVVENPTELAGDV